MMRWLAPAVLTFIALLAACNGGSDDEPAPARSPSPALSPTRQAVATPPARPATIADYPGAVTQYLTADPAAFEACLAPLLEAWAMPGLATADACRKANVDDDEGDELIVVFTAARTTGLAYSVVVFDVAAGGAWANAWTSDVVTTSAGDLSPVLAAGNVTATGAAGGALAFEVNACGSDAGCIVDIRIIKGSASGYDDVTPAGGVQAPAGGARFEDIDGDGAQELLAPVAHTPDPAAGPSRAETAVYAWDGASYALRETRAGEPIYLYHAILDADALINAGRLDEGAGALEAAMADASLLVWDEARNERAELEAYALYRAGAARIVDGDEASGLTLLGRAAAMQGLLHAQLAGAFRAGYDVRGDIGVACSVVNEDVSRNLAEYDAFWNFGAANPPFDATAVCPF